MKRKKETKLTRKESINLKGSMMFKRKENTWLRLEG